MTAPAQAPAKYPGSGSESPYKSNTGIIRNISQLWQKLVFFIYPGILQTDDILVKYLLNKQFRLRSRGAGAEIANFSSGSGTTK